MKRKQIEISKNFHTKTGELTLARGDQAVSNLLVSLEESERRWKEELATRRRKKFSNYWLITRHGDEGRYQGK